MAKKTKAELEAARIAQKMKDTGWCHNCAKENCAQGFCCGHPSRQKRSGYAPSAWDDSFYN